MDNYHLLLLGVIIIAASAVLYWLLRQRLSGVTPGPKPDNAPKDHLEFEQARRKEEAARVEEQLNGKYWNKGKTRLS